ncbi:3-oxoacyl-[ACP] synthase III in alkane synthesis cluster [hydrothermal vent metagenome]|uniref:3-oxoacyl-[ACP] synthase III in alkane synthesis cluster n=1 Tax=hydrothermal vent metagenome TaxID=652676 RepID=A0A3B1DDP1_9ZZZZ
MTGIKERRFFDPGVLPGSISRETAIKAIETSGIDREHFSALIHASVCRDQLEPATACGVHHATGMKKNALVLDVSNACLGLLNGMLLLANMIELGQLRAGVVVGTETGRNLVEGTIAELLSSPTITRQDVKNHFASLTIGSGSAAIVLCDRQLSRRGNRLLGGACLTDTSHHALCEGGTDTEKSNDGRPRMNTNSEALLHAGVALAKKTWEETKRTLCWENSDVDKVFTHQVGRAHRKLLLEELDLSPALDFPTVEQFGNTGAAALPMALSLGIEQNHLVPNDNIALLGIGSGLNSVMLGLNWQSTNSK